jgi:hypothetical protein
MTDRKRRRLMQAGVSLPLVGWSAAWAQSPERNLVAGERKEGPGVAGGGMPLLVAPRRALVIGNSSYGFGPLKNPANDAKAIGEELKRSGFEVTTGLDLPRTEMLEAIRAYAESLTKAKAVGVFYYAGHGVQVRGARKRASRTPKIRMRCGFGRASGSGLPAATRGG